jgi:hypothetical protein
VTDSSVVERGAVNRLASNNGGDSIGSAVFTIAGTKVFELRHRCGTTIATNGFGFPGGFGTEVYSEIWGWKVA